MSSENVDLSQYKLSLIDTIKVNYVGRTVKIIDYNKKNGNMLLCDITSIDRVVQIDSSGKLLNTILLSGEGPNEPGGSIFNVGYYNDSTIIVNSNRGFYIYNERGNLKEIIKEKTAIMGYGAGVLPRIRHVVSSGNYLLFMHLKSSIVRSLFRKEGYETYNPVTVFNTKNRETKIVAGYEPESIFRENKVFFGDPINVFDVDSNYLYSTGLSYKTGK